MNSFDPWGPGLLGHHSEDPAAPYPNQYGYAVAPPAPYVTYRSNPIIHTAAGYSMGMPPPAYGLSPPAYGLSPPRYITYYSSALGRHVTELTTAPAPQLIRDLPVPQGIGANLWEPSAAEVERWWTREVPARVPRYVPPMPMPMPQVEKSLQTSAYHDDDHPSALRPPHRPIERRPKASQVESVSFIAPIAIAEPSVAAAVPEPTIVEENLVPNSYPVPPPPPYNKSAAPLADYAAEMVWDRCFGSPNLGRKKFISAAGFNDSTIKRSADIVDSPSASLTAKVLHHHAPQVGGRASIRSSPGSFGAIGGEAKARRASRGSAGTYGFQPDSPAPTAAEKARFGFSGGKTEVKPAFRKWCKQILEATLLSPQVLMLALLYVDAVRDQDVFGDGKTQMTPYKLLLAALVLANKILDDHSYKNSTFANVSAMSNVEVNALEAALLVALKYNTVPKDQEWSAWLREVVTFGDKIRFNMSTGKVEGVPFPTAPLPSAVTTEPAEAKSKGRPSVVERMTTRRPTLRPMAVSCVLSGGASEAAGRMFGSELSNHSMVVDSF